MSHDGKAVANVVLEICWAADRPVTNLAVQKIVYFCHVWSLIDLKRPLIRHAFEAWRHGPVLPYLYHEFKEFGERPIRRKAYRVDLKTGERIVAMDLFDQPAQDVIERVTNFYGRLPARTLVDMTHVENGPWHQVWNHDGFSNPGMNIRDEDIVKFYSRSHHLQRMQ